MKILKIIGHFYLFAFIAIICIGNNVKAAVFERNNRKIQATEIMVAIERGDTIQISDSEVQGDLVFSEFWHATPITVNGVVAISRTKFNGNVYLEECYFFDKLEFEECSFSRAFDVRKSRFYGDCSFRGCSFDSNCSFTYSSFVKEADFSSATFDHMTILEKSNFTGQAFFQRVTFNASVSFGASRFLDNVHFAEAFCKDEVDFSGTYFEKNVDLGFKKWEGLFVTYEQLKGHLTYDRFGSRSIFMLIKQFENNRQLGDADKLYLFLKDQERMSKPILIRYLEYWFIQIPCGYGVSPLNTLATSAVIIAIFTFLFAIENSIRNVKSDLANRRRRRTLRCAVKRLRTRLGDAFYFSFHIFVVGVATEWYPTEEFLITYGKIRLVKFRTLAMIEGALGWILLVLFVVTLTRKFIR